MDISKFPSLFVQVFCTLALSSVLILFLKDLCIRHGVLYDIPEGRKQHEHATPAAGGASFALAFFAMASLRFGVDTFGLWPFLLPAACLTMLGIADDAWDLSPLTKLGVQLSCVAIALYYSLPLDKWIELTPSVLAPVAVALVLGFLVFFAGFFVNAFNMTDGVDGMAGSIALCSLLFCGVCAYLVGSTLHLALALLLAGAVAGFLAWNLRAPWRSRAAVFMGDAGSLMLGFALVWFALTLSEWPGVPLLLPLWLLAYPLLDAVFVAVRRLRNGRNPMKADRTHFHHLMQLRGLSVSQAVLAACTLVTVYAVVGIFLWKAKSSGFTQVVAAAGGAFSYFAGMAYLWKKQGNSNE